MYATSLYHKCLHRVLPTRCLTHDLSLPTTRAWALGHVDVTVTTAASSGQVLCARLIELQQYCVVVLHLGLIIVSRLWSNGCTALSDP